MTIVERQDLAQEFRLGEGERLDHVPSVVRVEEELSAAGVARELVEVELPAYAVEEGLLLDAEEAAYPSEYEGRVHLELVLVR